MQNSSLHFVENSNFQLVLFNPPPPIVPGSPPPIVPGKASPRRSDRLAAPISSILLKAGILHKAYISLNKHEITLKSTINTWTNNVLNIILLLTYSLVSY